MDILPSMTNKLTHEFSSPKSAFVKVVPDASSEKQTIDSVEACKNSSNGKIESQHQSMVSPVPEPQPLINLSYRGQKHDFMIGKYAARHDVLYKTLLRTMRRFLWELYTQRFRDSPLKSNKKASQTYQFRIEIMAQDLFSSYLD